MMLCDEANTCVNGSWYLVHCQSRKETYAAKSLRHLLKLRVFLPQERVRWHGEVRFSPFFPGYLFVLADLQDTPLSSINTCPGVLRLVGFGGYPQSVPFSVIETITQQLEHESAGDRVSSRTFEPGDAVRVKSGPLQDLNMIFIGPTSPDKRVHVLLTFMGRLKDVQVDVEMLEKVPANARHATISLDRGKPRVRYTRGKGRKIYPLQDLRC